MYYKLDEEKNTIPCTVDEWSRSYQDFEKNKRIELTAEFGLYSLSTVFLGLDHGFADKKLLFESLLSVHIPIVSQSGNIVTYGHSLGGYYDGYMDRYETYKEAVEGHKKILRELQEHLSHLRHKT
jgi:hypothetical protein